MTSTPQTIYYEATTIDLKFYNVLQLSLNWKRVCAKTFVRGFRSSRMFIEKSIERFPP